MSTKRLGCFAVISDIHANLQALQAVLEALEEESISRIYCCGDIVGYGGNPNECTDLIRSRDIPVVAGNHDHAALLLTDIHYFNDVARAAVMWTKEALTSENSKFLRDLPMSIHAGDYLIVHASPKDPEEWNYILTMGEARLNFDYFEERVCFLGHSHQPFIVENCHGQLTCPPAADTELKDDCRYLVNVGSIGQPRDRNPLACFVVVDEDTNLLQFRRVPYDVEAARAAILDQGLPRELAERLNHGW